MTRLLLALSMCFITVTALAQQTITAQAFRTVNVRTGPGTQYEIAGQLRGDTTVTVTGRSDTESNWLQIEFGGGEGWIAFFTVTLNGSPDILPIREPQVTPAATPFSSAQDNALTLSAETEVYVTAFRRVNVRSGPSTAFGRIGSLNPGDSADVNGQSADHDWLLIDYAGDSGWVAYYVVSVTGDLAALPVMETLALDDDISSESAAVPVVTITTRFNTNLRERPSFDGVIIDVIPFNTTVEIEARSIDSSWLRVTYEGSTGWLMGMLVNVNEDERLEVLPVE